MKKIYKLYLLLFFVPAFAFPQAGKVQRPNIIFILADDLGIGDIGCYGQKIISTPNIDQLAKEGMQFSRYYSGSSVCAPARTTFMTGMHTGHTPVRGNKTFPPEGQFPLPDSSVTFVQLLQKAGYKTGAFGKWSLGFINTSGSPSKKGFDHFFGYNCQTLAHNYYPDHLWDNDTRIEFPGNESDHTVYSADLIHQKALDFLKEQSIAKSFFLYLPYTLPHADITVPHDSVYEHYVQLIGEKASKKPTNPKDSNKVFESYPLAAYAAMVARLDKYVGEIVSLVKQNKLDKNTLIIFTSDNGPHKEDGHDPVYFKSNAGLRGIKRDLYEGGIREPFIASWKGMIKPASKADMPCAMWDMFPTFLELAGLKQLPGKDGISLKNLITGKKQQTHDHLYWELHEAGGKQAILMGNWKAVKLNVTEKEDVPIELYDLSADPAEKNNIATDHPEIVIKMKQLFATEHKTDNNWLLLKTELTSK